MPRARSTDTADRIRASAMAVIADKGVQDASLREIAERAGITKPALYYHFGSREELLRALVQPLVDDVEAVLAALERDSGGDPRAVLGGYFDVAYRHRAITGMIMGDPRLLAHVDLASAVADWRRRLTVLLVGPTPTMEDRARVALAIGGLSDCAALFVDAPPGTLRATVLDAACAALGR